MSGVWKYFAFDAGEDKAILDTNSASEVFKQKKEARQSWPNTSDRHLDVYSEFKASFVFTITVCHDTFIRICLRSIIRA